MTQAPTLERVKVQEAMFLVLGQDHKHAVSGRPFKGSSKGRGYAAADYDMADENDLDDVTVADEAYYEGSWDGYEDEGSWENEEIYYEDDGSHFDGDAGYYQQVEEPAVDMPYVEEYDEAFAAYVDARKRFNDIKLSRGYLPIVALTESQSNLAPGLTSPSTSPSHGKGKKGKSPKGKGKSKTTIRYSSKGRGKSPDPRGRAQASMVCLRCGGNHFTNMCPVQRSTTSPSSGQKRPAPTTESTVFDGVPESGMVIFQDCYGQERPDCVMLDPGASAFLSGFGPFKRYVTELASRGFDLDRLQFHRCQRRFHFGGDAQADCLWTVKLPIFVGGRYGLVQMYLLRGETPMLLGRPIMENLGILLDCQNKKLKLDDSPWFDAVVGANGEYLLPLLDDYAEDLLRGGPSFDLVVPADGGASPGVVTFENFDKEEMVFSVAVEAESPSSPPPLGDRPLRRHFIQTCETNLTTEENQLQAYVTAEIHKPKERPRALWEVYCGHGRTSQLAETMGMEVRVFSYETGWDFDNPLHRSQFLALLSQEMPDELFLAPECKLWSVMQNINARDEKQREKLKIYRDHHHKTHLMFVRRAFLLQVHGGRHTHLEQPEGALSWQTGALSSLPGHWACFDQCRYGVMCLDEDGIWKPVKKATAILTTKMAVQAALHLRCCHDHEHCRLEGSAAGYGSRTKYVEDYQPSLAATIAAALMVNEPPQQWEMAMAVPDHQEFSGRLAALHTTVGAEAVRTVQRLHRNLGHPSTEALVDLLTARGASAEVLTAAQSYQCAACLRYKKPNQVAPASAKLVKEFNEVIQSDVFWIRVGTKKFPILSVIDQATKFQAAALLHGERGEDLVAALERCWVRHFGAPQKLVSDEGRGWVGDQMEQWTNFNSVEHEVAPGEAHSRLALVERRHSVLRKAIELYLEEMKMDDDNGVRKALTYVLPQVNSAPTVAGFSPCQWLLGKQVRLPGELSLDHVNPALLGGHSHFEQLLQHRNAAKRALLEAETDAKLRRALLRKYQGNNIPLKNGQRCYFWRDARQGDLVKIRWHGPARVVMVEYDEEQVPKVYWIAYKTQLIRCAPHHVRSDYTTADHSIEDLQSAKKEVQGLKSRGVTRFLDLNLLNRNHIDDVLEEDEEMAGDDYDDDFGGGEEPPRQRRRITPALPQQDDVDYSPTTVGDPEEQLDEPLMAAAPIPDDGGDPPLLPQGGHADETVSLDLTEFFDSPQHQDLPNTATEPSAEPSAQPTMPATPAGNTAPAVALPSNGLDPNFVSLYEIAGPESFHQRRLRMDKQETYGFGPSREPRQRNNQPYPPPTQAGTSLPSQPSNPTTTSPHSVLQPEPSSVPQPAADIPVLDEEELYSQAFEVQEVSENDVPLGWRLDGSGYFQLDHKMHDYWEIRAGCVIRHHPTPRRKFFRLNNVKDCPFLPEQLDLTRVTLVRASNGTHGIHIDSDIVDYEMDYLWTGLTIYQIKGEVRREMAMTTHSRPMTLAKQYVRFEKKKADKNKSNLTERSMTLHEKELFMQAKVKELKSFFENGVWEFSTAAEADPSRTLSSRLLLKWSKNPDGTPRAKARLIVRGYADRDALEGKIDTAAPTTSRLSRSMLLSMMATMRWNCWTADVSTAFLQGLPQERQLWVKLPAEALKILGAAPDTRMFLKKPCYGQLDAPRRWFLEAVRRLKSLGFRQHILDPCLFLLYENDFKEVNSDGAGTFGEHHLCGMICLHVDDMLGCGNLSSPVYNKVEKKLKETFSFREWQTSSKLEYCGATLEKEEDTGTWKLHHGEYLRKVKPITMDRGRGAEDYMTPNEVTKFRGLLGSLQWPAVQSQPHLQCSASLLAGQMSTGLVKSITDANKLLKFAKENSDVALRYSYLDEPQNLRLVCMFDAAFCVRRDNASQGGYIVMLVPESMFHGKESEYHVIDWKSSKLPRVARSSLGAEAQAAGQAADSVDFICKFWDHLCFPEKTLEQLLQSSSELKPTLITVPRPFTTRTFVKVQHRPSRTRGWAWRSKSPKKGCRSWEELWSGSARRDSLRTASPRSRQDSYLQTGFDTTDWSWLGILNIKQQRRSPWKIAIGVEMSLPFPRLQVAKIQCSEMVMEEIYYQRCLSMARMRMTSRWTMRRRWWQGLRTLSSMSTFCRMTSRRAMAWSGATASRTLSSMSWRLFGRYFGCWLWDGSLVWRPWNSQNWSNVLPLLRKLKRWMHPGLGGSRLWCWPCGPRLALWALWLARRLAGEADVNTVYMWGISVTREQQQGVLNWSSRWRIWRRTWLSSDPSATTMEGVWWISAMRTMTLQSLSCSSRTVWRKRMRSFVKCEDELLYYKIE